MPFNKNNLEKPQFLYIKFTYKETPKYLALLEK